MTGYAASAKRATRRHSRGEWWLMGGGTVVAALALILVGMLVRATDVPRVAIPSPAPLPSPNAFDVFLRAASLTTGEAGEMTMGIRPEPSPAERTAMLRRNRMALDVFRTGFDYPYQNPPARTYRHQLSYLVSLSELSQTAVWEAKDLWKRGETAAAAETCLDLVRFGTVVLRGGGLRHLITSLNIEEDGREGLWKMRGTLPAAVARTTVRELCELEGQRVPYTAVLEEIKWSAVSATLELYRTGRLHRALNNAGQTAQNVSSPPWWEGIGTSLSLAPFPPRQVLAKMTDYLDAHIERAKQPYTPRPLAIPLPADPVNRLMVNLEYQGVHTLARENEMQHRLLTLALALQAYREEKGDYPEDLNRLVSAAYIPVVPDDPFTEKLPLRYRRLSASRYLLYSVGPDSQDNNGTPIMDKTDKDEPVTGALTAEMTGDFVVGINIP